MAGKALVWDQVGEKLFETGVKKGVLYKRDASGAYPKGVAWNGLTAVNENPSGAEPTALYADDTKYVTIMSTEDYSLDIEAYMYPDEFAECDGSAELTEGVTIGQQTRKPFGFSWVTTIGNDVDGTDYGYKIHLVYGCLASPTEKNHSSINDSPDATNPSWSVSTTPVEVAGHKPTVTLEIDSTKVGEKALAAIEKVLYGSAEAEARLPLPDEVLSIIKAAAV